MGKVFRFFPLLFSLAVNLLVNGDCFAENLPRPLIFELGKNSVVHLESKGKLFNKKEEIFAGTGFFITEKGEILSNSHVIPHEENYENLKITAKYFSGEKFLGNPIMTSQTVEIVSRDSKFDLVLLRLIEEPSNLIPLSLGNSDNLREGEDITILGFPLNGGLSIGDGIFSSKEGGSNGQWKIDSHLNPGNSGGPLFDSQGEVVGITVGGIPRITIDNKEIDVEGINFFLPINVAKKEFLAEINFREGTKRDIASLKMPETFEKTYQVYRIKDDHPEIFPHSRNYELKFESEPGYIIQSADLKPLSITRCTDPAVNISPGGKSVSVTFSLESGPFFDRYRGWLKGNLQTVQKRSSS